MLRFRHAVALLPLITLGHATVLGTALRPRTTDPVCPNRIDISNPALPFLDYPAIQRAGDWVTAEIERIKGTSPPPDASSPPEEGGAQTPTRPPRCDRIRVRKEWRQLTRREKKAYLKAERCLQKHPDLGLMGGAEGFYSDGVTRAHGLGFGRFHAGPKFLPWHRWVVWFHGYSMEKLCGYTGPIPYWDYINDGPNIYKSPIWSTDPEVGFGNGGSVAINEIGGRAGGYIVDNGAFANYRPFLPVPHYLVRNFTPDNLYNPDNVYGIGLSDTYNRTALARVLSATNFWEFETMIDGLDEPQFRSIHNSMHFAIGGDGQSFNFFEGTPYWGVTVVGANDPVFFLHHATVDHVWWTWQQKGKLQQFDFRGREGGNDTMCDQLPMNGLGPDVYIALSLKTEWYPLCYTYNQPA